MSTLVNQYRKGKIENQYKFENVVSIWYTKTTKDTPQISITLTCNSVVSAWNLDEYDLELTRISFEKASANYNQKISKICGEVVGIMDEREKKRVKK